MCGRFAITLPDEAMAQLFDAVPGNDLPSFERYNVCPTTPITTVVSSAGSRRLRVMRWGFLPHWYKTPTDGPLLINARAETIAEKPAFRAACRTRRCLIPADGFYEWTKTTDNKRLPWYITRADQTPLVMAGVWQDWEVEGQGYTTVACVTCAASPDMAQLHHRQPVILTKEQWSLWLGESGHGAAKLMTAVPEGTLTWHRVSAEVNSNRASGPQLTEPLPV
ncbi:MAG: SOS response-associated peptidase [Pseudomonadota bacterium]